tara:strand:+ start:246 stop:467 length:222 start_codon:yes stop_codon:yes gene_type:complete
MEFKAGDIITYSMNNKPEIQGVIVNLWKEPNPWKAGIIDNVELFITFDSSWLSKLHKIETFCNFNPDVWELKK